LPAPTSDISNTFLQVKSSQLDATDLNHFAANFIQFPQWNCGLEKKSLKIETVNCDIFFQKRLLLLWQHQVRVHYIC